VRKRALMAETVARHEGRKERLEDILVVERLPRRAPDNWSNTTLDTAWSPERVNSFG